MCASYPNGVTRAKKVTDGFLCHLSASRHSILVNDSLGAPSRGWIATGQKDTRCML